MTRWISVLLGLLVTLAGCVSVNEVPPLLNLKANDKVADLKANGAVAFQADVRYKNRDQAIVFVQNEKGQTFEIPLNPVVTNSSTVSLGPWEVYRKETPREKNDYGMLLYQLAPGTYRTQYLVIWHDGTNFPRDLQEEEFRVVAGQVTYWGNYRLESDAQFLASKAYLVQRLEGPPREFFGTHALGDVPAVTFVNAPLTLSLKKK